MAKHYSSGTKAGKSKKRAPQKISDKFIDELFSNLMKEPPVVPENFCEAVDRELKYDINRRIALVFLSKPFREMEEAMRTNRDTAVAFSGCAASLTNTIERYKGLVVLLEKSKIRMEMALCGREDRQQLLAEGRNSLCDGEWIKEVERRAEDGEPCQSILDDLKARGRKTMH